MISIVNIIFIILINWQPDHLPNDAVHEINHSAFTRRKNKRTYLLLIMINVIDKIGIREGVCIMSRSLFRNIAHGYFIINGTHLCSIKGIRGVHETNVVSTRDK